MQISGCGYACGACRLMKTNECEGCNIVNEMLPCHILSCLRKNNLATCLDCESRLLCALYDKAVKHCPLEKALLDKKAWPPLEE